MSRKSLIVFVPVLLLGMTNLAAAQVVSVYECEAESQAAMENALDRFYQAMAGGLRPIMALDEFVWNGSNENTHRLIFAHADYQSFETFQARMAATPAAALVIEDSSEIAQCDTERLSLLRGEWGDVGSELPFISLTPITTSDAGRYAEAFAQMAESQTENTAPGAVRLFESRAGGDGANFFVALLAPSMSELNEWMDTTFQSDDFADFIDEVAEIRTVGSVSQMRRVRVWEP
jgi:hypothetical protein